MYGYCVNDLIAVEPFAKDLAVKINEKARLAGVAQKSELARTTVVYGGRDVPAGAVVFLSGEAHRNTEATRVFEVEPGRPFVLVPFSYIKVVFPTHRCGGCGRVAERGRVG